MKGAPFPFRTPKSNPSRRSLNGKSAVTPFPYLKEGQMVRVVYGPLKGSEGFLLKIKEGKEKLIISVDLLQRSVAVEIDGASVEPVTLF